MLELPQNCRHKGGLRKVAGQAASEREPKQGLNVNMIYIIYEYLYKYK